MLARNLGPAELLEYDRRFLKGVVLEEGSLTAHVTIVARAMGVPVLGRVRDLRTTIADGDELLLDGGDGSRCSSGRRRRCSSRSPRRARSRRKRQAEYRQVARPAGGDARRRAITLMMNAGLRGDAAALDATNADGIGLFRTEFQFLVSATLPRRERQTALYKTVLDAAGDRPVVFRTVDIGGDKAVPYMRDGDHATRTRRWAGARCASRSAAPG